MCLAHTWNQFMKLHTNLVGYAILMCSQTHYHITHSFWKHQCTFAYFCWEITRLWKSKAKPCPPLKVATLLPAHNRDEGRVDCGQPCPRLCLQWGAWQALPFAQLLRNVPVLSLHIAVQTHWYSRSVCTYKRKRESAAGFMLYIRRGIQGPYSAPANHNALQWVHFNDTGKQHTESGLAQCQARH